MGLRVTLERQKEGAKEVTISLIVFHILFFFLSIVMIPFQYEKTVSRIVHLIFLKFGMGLLSLC